MIAFHVGLIARAYDIKILYGPLLRGHLERLLHARDLDLLACVQARDDLRRGRSSASLRQRSHVNYADALKGLRQPASLGHAFISVVGCPGAMPEAKMASGGLGNRWQDV